MTLIDVVLRPPTYGWARPDGSAVRPSNAQILREFASRLDVVKDRRNWLALSSWLAPLLLTPFLVLFFVKYFSWPLLLVGFVYSMIAMGSHGTLWYHRYCTHGAYTFSHPLWRFMTRNLVVKMVSEELYVVSHLVHHKQSDQVGDPYNASCGFLYSFLADAIHQPISHTLDPAQYAKTAGFMKRSGIHTSTFAQYQRWGSVSHPLYLWTGTLMNWAFWYAVMYALGGHALGSAIFGSAVVWAIGVRTFNFEGHGKGTDRRVEGYDFSARDQSVNQYWPGFVAGEWHSNHHLYASSARTGFLPHQIDIPFYYVWVLSKLGAISKYTDSKAHFLEHHYQPYLDGLAHAAPGDR